MHIEMKTQFKIIYFITSHSKRVCTHGLECPYGAYIFTPSLFFINSDMYKLLTHIICPFCAYATFINETPGLSGEWFEKRHSEERETDQTDVVPLAL